MIAELLIVAAVLVAIAGVAMAALQAQQVKRAQAQIRIAERSARKLKRLAEERSDLLALTAAGLRVFGDGLSRLANQGEVEQTQEIRAMGMLGSAIRTWAIDLGAGRSRQETTMCVCKDAVAALNRIGRTAPIDVSLAFLINEAMRLRNQYEGAWPSGETIIVRAPSAEMIDDVEASFKEDANAFGDSHIESYSTREPVLTFEPTIEAHSN